MRDLKLMMAISAPAVPGAAEVAAAGVDTPLRLTLGLDGGEASAGVMDLNAVLEGAQPVQISRLSSSLSHEIRNPLS